MTKCRESLTGEDTLVINGQEVKGFCADKDLNFPDEKETEEEIKKRARKPPSGGKCIKCGENKPINRLLLCYPCWVKSENGKKGWKEGQSHPSECGCDAPGGCRPAGGGSN